MGRKMGLQKYYGVGSLLINHEHGTVNTMGFYTAHIKRYENKM